MRNSAAVLLAQSSLYQQAARKGLQQDAGAGQGITNCPQALTKMKKMVNPYEYVRAHISEINFQVLSADQIESLGVAEIVRKEIYDPMTRMPMDGGPLDQRLGLSRKDGKCRTCSEPLASCSGHFGWYKLALPVFHAGFFRHVYVICQMICKSCSRVMLDPTKKMKYIQSLRSSSELGQKRIISKISSECKKTTVCFYCKSVNGKIKKASGMKIFLDASEKGAPALKEDLNALRCLNLFRNIPADEYALLGINQSPVNFLIERIVIPPASIRPSVPVGQDGSNEDDLTVKISEIIHCNQILVSSVQKGCPYSVILEDWDFLQSQCAQLIQPDSSGKQIKGLLQRLKGKHGRFRGNLSGKRVDFSSRTVISPDPNLQVDQVGVPRHIAKVLTIPERVTEFNIKKLQRLVVNGEKYPGANYIIYTNAPQPTSGGSSGVLQDAQSAGSSSVNAKSKTVSGGAHKTARQNTGSAGAPGQEMKVFLKYGDRRRAAQSLSIGDIVERHLQDGDIVLFNRQPSLHRLSIMAHRVKVHADKTFKLNECVCTPYNADFDGDEMNMHVLQTYESRAEAGELMGIKVNLLNPRNGEPLIAAIQDFITGAYLLTSRNTFFTAAEMGQYTSNLHIRISTRPAIVRPYRLYTGKQLVQAMLDEACCSEPGKESAERHERARTGSRVDVTLISRNRTYVSDWDVKDGYFVVVRNNYLFGRMDKSIIGTENKETSLLYVLSRKSNTSVLRFLALISRLRFLTNFGFSMGLDDVTPNSRLNNEKARLFEREYAKINTKIDDYRAKNLELEPGCSLEETLESHIKSILNSLRESCGNLCIGKLNINNVPIIMHNCGSKGSKINISQMVACVGQQIISGKRVPNGFSRRTLPHFEPESKAPCDKGFVASSFRSGLTSPEFFFHAVSGREGLVDTAVKTAETGYMQRRLMKALEDLSVMYDGTVRSPDGSLVQYVYGEDCMDPCLVEGSEKVRMDVLYEEVAAEINHHLAAGRDWSGRAVYKDTRKPELQQDRTGEQIEKFLEEMLSKRGSPLLREYVQRNKERFVALFKHVYEQKLESAKVEPGTAVGALACQSIGEPGTQMTLKTFHFAGVASMNITLGVPRLKEIINAVKNISTPIIKACLCCTDSLEEARRIKGRIDRVYLKDIVSSITEIYTKNDIFLELEVSLQTISNLRLEIGLDHIKTVIDSEISSRTHVSKAHAGKSDVEVPFRADTGKFHFESYVKENKIVLRTNREDNKYFEMKGLKRALDLIIVSRIKTVKRVVLAKDGEYKLFVEGTGLRQILGTEGVDYKRTTTNNIMEIEGTLGIEATRESIIREMQYTVSSHGIKIDVRHLMLLADTMTSRGELLGITRFGISKMKGSTLMLASFEQTGDHLFDAAIRNKGGAIKGVSESIIMGRPISMGTGGVELFYKKQFSS